VVRALLAAKVDVDAKTADGVTALIIASQKGHLEVVRALLAAKANVNVKAANDPQFFPTSQKLREFQRDLLASMNVKPASGVTALMTASQNGDLEVVRALLAAKADVNAKRTDGVTALMAASLKGHLEVVRALLFAKADVNAKAANGETAMSLATKGGFLQIVLLLKASL
jgi:ankyrin repeat protein